MKGTPIFIVASLALNLALGWKLFGGRVTPHLESSRGITSAAASASSATARPAPADAKAAAFPTTPAEQRDRLLALGFPPEVVRAAIRAMLEEPRLARQREFNAQAAKQPWWRGGIVTQNITREQQKELNALRKTEREEIARVLGPEGALQQGDTDRYGFLEPAKAARLAGLDRDYNDARREAGGDGTGPEVAERQRKLKEDYDREVAALLTPEERTALAQRDSSAAQSLRYRFDFFPGTTQEYETLFGLQKAFDDKFAPGMPRSPEARAEWGAAMQQLGQDIEAALGPERFNAYLLAQRPEYRALVNLQERFSVPAAAFDQVARLQGEILATNLKLRGSESDAAEKLATIRSLADRARTEVRAALGPELGEKFLAATKGMWLGLLDQGNLYGAQATGGTWVGPAVPPKK